MENIIVCACFLGFSCLFDVNSKPCIVVISLKEKYNLIPVCPEIMGGLPTPRLSSEIRGELVVMKDGSDVTKEYKRGAEEVLRLAQMFECKIAVLKENSPSCGCGKIYDGTFSRKLIDGNGITAGLLLKNGIKVFGETASFLHLKN